jgi:hypothetical protein
LFVRCRECRAKADAGLSSLLRFGHKKAPP